ncbi:MAG: hypothetical protein ACLP05_12405 [Candidatus Kryptoniota bacterium]
MNKTSKGILFWSPRVLCILFALFLSIFALDVFNEGYDFWKTLLALAIHLIPSIIILLFLIIAWRWEWIGGIAFLILAVSYVVMAWRRFPLSVYFVVAGPMVLISILFFVNWKYRTEVHTKSLAP